MFTSLCTRGIFGLCLTIMCQRRCVLKLKETGNLLKSIAVDVIYLKIMVPFAWTVTINSELLWCCIILVNPHSLEKCTPSIFQVVWVSVFERLLKSIPVWAPCSRRWRWRVSLRDVISCITGRFKNILAVVSCEGRNRRVGWGSHCKLYYFCSVPCCCSNV